VSGASRPITPSGTACRLGGALVHDAERAETPEQLGEGRRSAIDLGAHGLDGFVQVVEVDVGVAVTGRPGRSGAGGHC
jgi:hypothetical protein